MVAPHRKAVRAIREGDRSQRAEQNVICAVTVAVELPHTDRHARSARQCLMIDASQTYFRGRSGTTNSFELMGTQPPRRMAADPFANER